MTDITPNQWTILERMESGPCWMRSFQTVKPLVEDLCQRGLIERRPLKNMVRLTESGCVILGLSVNDVPSELAPTRPEIPKAKVLGSIIDGISDLTRSTCEKYRSAIEAGEPQSTIISRLAAASSVNRPAIFARLRHGGILPRCKSERREHLPKVRRRVGQDEQRVLPPRTHRDPCPRCGVRADIGCSHAPCQLGTMF